MGINSVPSSGNCSKKELKADVLHEEINSTTGLLESGRTNSTKAAKKSTKVHWSKWRYEVAE